MGVTAAVAVVGAVASYAGSSQAADAAESAAKAKKGAADAWSDQVSANSDRAQGILNNAVTPAAMAAYTQTLNNQERVVQRQETLAQSLSPALIEAGKQTKALLDGQSAPVLDNIKNQRQLQRQNLLDSLRGQYGAGAENSSAGQQALQKFDAETANQTSQAQQQYLQQVSGLSLSGMQQVTGVSSQANTVQANLINNNPMIQNARDKASSLAQFSGMQGQAEAAGVDAAGGQYAGDAIRGQATQALGSSIIQGAAAYAGGSRSAKTTSPQGGTVGQDLQMPNQASNNPNGYGYGSKSSYL